MTSRRRPGKAERPEAGAGGTSLRSLEPARARQSLGRALLNLNRWREPLRGGPILVDHFPFRDIVAHYQAVGRTYADPELVAALHALSAALPRADSVEAGVLTSWLPYTFDQDNGTYDSYAAIPMLEELAAASRDTDEALDGEIVALLADLLLFESTALAAEPGSLAQQVRTRACLRAVTRAGELAPRVHTRVPRQPPAAGSWRGIRDPALLANTALELARSVLRRTPPILRHAAGIAMLPMTTLHDEVLFIRSVQTFELLYRRLARRLEWAVMALRRGELGETVARIEDAAMRVAATTMLYRVLTTMPRDAFAVIREHTQGRSAVQSRAFRAVERISSPGGTNEYATPVQVSGPTLQEVYEWRLAAWGPLALSGLTDAMLMLDETWRGMKRTHWGITLKIIGRVPGTGGTAGADYLKMAAERPLFPLLHAPAEPGDHAEGARIA